MVAVFASGLHGKTNNDIHIECHNHNNTEGTNVFPANNLTVQADIYKGGVFLGCVFGKLIDSMLNFSKFLLDF